MVVIATHNVVKLPTKATSSTLCEYTASIYRRLLYCNAILVCARLGADHGSLSHERFPRVATGRDSLTCAIILEDLSLKYQYFVFA